MALHNGAHTSPWSAGEFMAKTKQSALKSRQIRSKPADLWSCVVKTGILILMNSFFVLFSPLSLTAAIFVFLASTRSCSRCQFVNIQTCASEDVEGSSLPLLEGLWKYDSEPSVHWNGAVWLTLHKITENRAEEQVFPYFSISPKELIFFTGLLEETHFGNGTKCSEIIFTKEFLCKYLLFGQFLSQIYSAETSIVLVHW